MFHIRLFVGVYGLSASVAYLNVKLREPIMLPSAKMLT